MAMLVRKESTHIPSECPSSKTAIAQGVESAMSGGVLQPSPLLPERVEPSGPKPKAKVVRLKQKKPKVQKKTKPSAKAKVVHKIVDEVDDTIAYEAWLRGYASLTQDPNVAQLAGRTKANTIDGRRTKVNRILACWLEDGDKWGGTPQGKNEDGFDTISYPTRWKYKQAARSSQAARLAVAHESVPVSEAWEASSYSKQAGAIQGFEVFARPPSLDDMWTKHRIDLMSGKLTEQTIHENSELKGFSFSVDHKCAVGVKCLIEDPQGNRFSLPWNFTSRDSSYQVTRSKVYSGIAQHIEKLLDLPWTPDSWKDQGQGKVEAFIATESKSTQEVPVTELTQYGSPISNMDVAKEVMKALAGAYQTTGPMPSSVKVEATNDSSGLLQEVRSCKEAARMYKWFKKHHRVEDNGPSMVDQIMIRKLSRKGFAAYMDIRDAHKRHAKSDMLFEWMAYKGCGMTQLELEKKFQWWECNINRVRPPVQKTKQIPLSNDPYEQMVAHWMYQFQCGRISEEQYSHIVGRIKLRKTLNAKFQDQLAGGVYPPLIQLRYPKRTRKSHAGDYPWEVKVMANRLNVDARTIESMDVVSPVRETIEAQGVEVITKDQWVNFEKIVDFEDARKNSPRIGMDQVERASFGLSSFHKVGDSLLFVPTLYSSARTDPSIGDDSFGIVESIEDGVVVEGGKVTMSESKWLQMATKMREIGEFLARVAPK